MLILSYTSPDFCRFPSSERNLAASCLWRPKLTSHHLCIHGLRHSPCIQAKLEGLCLEVTETMPFKEVPALNSRDRSAILDRIKSCTEDKDLGKTNKVHADVMKRGLIPRDAYISVSLLKAYAKCGALDKAQEMFDQLLVRNNMAWNALIVGYSLHRRGNDVLKWFEQMQAEGIPPDAVTCSCALKACGIVKDLKMGEYIDVEVRKRGLLQNDIVLCNSLIDMYAKCGALRKARMVFDQLPVRDVVSWNALISGYANHGRGHDALRCFEQMMNEGFSPDIVTYVCCLKACGAIRSLQDGERIAFEIGEKGLLQRNAVLGTAVIDMFCKCGALVRAREAFEEVRKLQNAASWNALITGYVQHGLCVEALKCFRQMQKEKICPDAITYICLLKACGALGFVNIGEDIGTEVKKKGLLQDDVILGTTLVDMYAKCGALEKAQRVFEQLPRRNVISWNTLIAGYVQHDLNDKALKCFRQMQDEGISPSAVTYICIAKASGNMQRLEIGEAIDADIRKQGLLQKDTVLGTALVDMYVKCGALVKAREVFDLLAVRDVVSWTALIAGYADHGLGGEALTCYRQMQDDGIYPNAATYISILKVCVTAGSLEIIYGIDAEIRNQGLLRNDVVLGNTLLDTYAKRGVLEKAKEVFEELPMRDVVSWTTLITCYVEFRLAGEALTCFRMMQDEGIPPNAITYDAVLKACGIVGCLQMGEVIDTKVRELGLLQKDFVLGNTLVDMYAKCGASEKAHEVFRLLPVRNIVSWTTLMAGYAQLGEAEVVLDLFSEMRTDGVSPNLVTFLISLTACSHAGLLKEGEKMFDDMCTVYSLVPAIEHYTCMIDLFGRAGHIQKAKLLLDEVPASARLPLLLAILSACYKWLNLELGEWAFEQSLQLDDKCAAAYLCMKNIYVAAGILAEADDIES